MKPLPVEQIAVRDHFRSGDHFRSIAAVLWLKDVVIAVIAFKI